jgi:TPR repeat protein
VFTAGGVQGGAGGQQDYAEAARFFQLAADQDKKSAQKHLGLLYFNGHGVQRNCDTALHWLRLSGQTDDRTTNAIAEIEKSAHDFLHTSTDAQFTMIEAGESVFGQAQDGTGDFALHVAARQMQAETVALLFDHPSFDDLVLRMNTAGELPREW